jgi:hypothetical protein
MVYIKRILEGSMSCFQYSTDLQHHWMPNMGERIVWLSAHDTSRRDVPGFFILTCVLPFDKRAPHHIKMEEKSLTRGVTK